MAAEPLPKQFPGTHTQYSGHVRSFTRVLLIRPYPWVVTSPKLEWVSRWQFSVHHPARTLGFVRRSELCGVILSCPGCGKMKAAIQTRGVAHQLICRNAGCWDRWVIDRFMLTDLLRTITKEASALATVKPYRWQDGLTPYRLPGWALQDNMWGGAPVNQSQVPVDNWALALSMS